MEISSTFDFDEDENDIDEDIKEIEESLKNYDHTTLETTESDFFSLPNKFQKPSNEKQEKVDKSKPPSLKFNLDNQFENLQQKKQIEFMISGGTEKEWIKKDKDQKKKIISDSCKTYGKWFMEAAQKGTIQNEFLKEQAQINLADWKHFFEQRDENKIEYENLKLTTPLKKYQVELTNTIKKSIKTYGWKNNGHLMMVKQGLGKTISALEILCHYLQNPKNTQRGILILNINTEMIYQWGKEILEHTNLPLRRIFIPDSLKNLKIPETDDFFIVLSTYSAFSRATTESLKFLAKFPWGVMITDEAHAYKNKSSETFQRMMEFSELLNHKFYKICLSGTFMVNGPYDLVTQALWLKNDYQCPYHGTTHLYSQLQFWQNLITDSSKKEREKTLNREKILQKTDNSLADNNNNNNNDKKLSVKEKKEHLLLKIKVEYEHKKQKEEAALNYEKLTNEKTLSEEEYDEWYQRYVISIPKSKEFEIRESFGFTVTRNIILFDLDAESKKIYDVLSTFFSLYAKRLQENNNKKENRQYIMVTLVFMGVVLDHPGCLRECFWAS